MFDLDALVSDCLEAVRCDDAKARVNDLVRKAVEQPASLMQALGEPQSAGVNKIYVSDELTVLNLIWGPEMYLYPHDHQMWAVIGLYTGREDNTFYQRSETGLAQHATRTMEEKQVAQLGVDAIHAVRNPLQKLTGALHIYGGDFFQTPRSEWDPDTMQEQPYSVERALQTFEDSNRHLQVLREKGVMA